MLCRRIAAGQSCCGATRGEGEMRAGSRDVGTSDRHTGRRNGRGGSVPGTCRGSSVRRGRLAALLVVAVLGSLLAFPVVAVSTAPPASAADVPACLPGTNPNNANCVPADTVPDGGERPADPTPGPAEPWDANRVAIPVTISGPSIGGLCPGGSVPVSRLPCTHFGVSGGARVYVPGGDSADVPGAYGIAVTEKSTGSQDDTCNYSPTWTCTLLLIYNPAQLQGSVSLIFSVSTMVIGDLNGDGNILDSIGYSFTMTLGGTAPSTPTASFEVGGGEGAAKTFRATSSDPGGSVLSHQWDYGDGQHGDGAFVAHTYNRPGRYTVSLTSTNLQGRAATTSKEVTVAATRLGLSIELLDGATPPLSPGVPVKARVTASASTDGAGALHGIRFTDGALLRVSPSGAFEITGGPDPTVPAAGFDLSAGQKQTFDVTIEPQITGRYTISSQVTATDDAGDHQTADASAPGEIGQALAVSIVLDPPFAEQKEGPDGPEPVDVTATVSLSNTTAAQMDSVMLTSLRVDRTKAGQMLAVTQTGGADPGDDGLPVGPLGPGETKQVTATFRATDDAEVEFSAMATGHLLDGRTEIGVGRRRWSVKPEKLLRVRTEVTSPEGDAFLPAGQTVRIKGTVKNLSTTASIEVGPLYPTLAGNAGAMSFAWSTSGTDPKDLVPGTNVVLDPGQSKDFTVRFLTGWSDPRALDGPKPSGGIKATATFTPWGVATLEDGTTQDVVPALIDGGASDLVHTIHIDDSIAIPTFSTTAWGGAIMVGAAEGIWSGGAAFVSSIGDLIALPYTVVAGTASMQQQVWDSFSDDEKEAFASDTAMMAAAVLARNLEFGKQGAQALYDLAKASTLRSMTEMADKWETGDYTDTTRLWTRYAADAVTQAVIPVALGKIAKSSAAVRALARAQEAIQTRMAPVLSDAALAKRIEQLGPILNALEDGTELLPEQLSTLYGITPEELVELQKLAEEFDVLLTVRSRHASSIDWIERYQAMLKPETLKIKTVSEYDVKLLGYRESDIGSLVFRKPEPLRAFDAGQGDLGRLVNDFVTSHGFEPGTTEWTNAVNRTMLRAREWRKWEKYYERWDAQGWIDVSMNYEGNAITDPVKAGRSSLGVAPLESGKFVGFRMRPIGTDDYVLEMMNNKVGRWVPVTGDIDPIAFTHLDGSPLTMEEHAALLDKMAKNPLLQSQHGESATFVEGGVGFIESQFKPNEPGLQIAPGGHLPRVVRLDTDPGRSVWNSPLDYHLRWKGGFVYSGSYIPKGAIPAPSLVAPPVTQPLPMRPRAVPRATTAEPNVGRCRITYGTAPEAVNAIMDVRGKLVTLGSDGKTTQDSTLQTECFTPGPPIDRQVRPVTGLTEDSPVGATEIEIPEGDPWLASAGDGLQVGDVVTIGAGTPDAETHTIVRFGSIIIDAPLEHAHAAGELIVVTARRSASETPSTAPPPTSTATTAAPPSAVPSSDPAVMLSHDSPGGVSVSGSSAVATDSGAVTTNGVSSLAMTGRDTDDELRWATAMLCVGLLFVGLTRRRPRIG